MKQRFRSKKYNVFPEEVVKILLRVNSDKGIQSIDSLETYAYEISKNLVCKKEEIKHSTKIKQYKNN